MKRILRLTALTAALAAPMGANAFESNPNIKPHEWKLLPPACLYVEGAPRRHSPEARQLHAGDKSWTHMHHYCWAIVQTFRTYSHKVSPRETRLYFGAAVENLNYVIARSSPGFPLRPDMFVRKANLLARLGNFIEAADAARQLISENPRFPEGYVALADVQIRAGRQDQARQTLAKGDEAVEDKARFELLKKQLALD